MGFILFIIIIAALCSGPRRPMYYRPMGFGPMYRRPLRPMGMHHHHHHGHMGHGPRGFGGPRDSMRGHR